MKSNNILIISDKDNRKYWEAITLPVRILLDKDLPFASIEQEYEVILVDISVIKDLFEMISSIHSSHPESRILVVHATPTWKFLRDVLALGAEDLIRKDSHPGETLKKIMSAES